MKKQHLSRAGIGVAIVVIVIAIAWMSGGDEEAQEPAAGASADKVVDLRQTVVKLLTTVEYDLVDEGIVLDDEHQVTVPLEGAGFLVAGPDGPLLVTAAHVGCPPWPDAPGTMTSGDTKVEYDKVNDVRFQVVIGPTSEKPTRILLDRSNDLMVISLDPDALKRLKLRPLPLSDSAEPIQSGDEVVAWGFPDKTPYPQARHGMRVVDVQPKYLVLDRPVEGGFSGGALLKGNDVAAIVVRSVKQQQALCVTVEQIHALCSKFESDAISYRPRMQPPK